MGLKGRSQERAGGAIRPGLRSEASVPAQWAARRQRQVSRSILCPAETGMSLCHPLVQSFASRIACTQLKS